MVRLVLTVVLAILGIFVHPFGPGIIDFIYRFLIFSGITYIAYISFRIPEDSDIDQPDSDSMAETPEPSVQQAEIESAIHMPPDPGDMIKNDERTREFILDQFMVMGNLLMPDNGWVFSKNNESGLDRLQYENFSGTSMSLEGKTYPLAGIFQILDASDNVLIENNMDQKSRLVDLYDQEKYQVSAFLGVPLQLPGGRKLFFCFDSATKEHFNREDAKIIQRITADIETFMINRMKAYDLLAQLGETQEQLDFAQKLNGCKTVGMAFDSLVEIIAKNFEASRLTLTVKRKDANMAVVKKVIGQQDEFEENSEFPLEEGLTGWVIGKNKPYLLDDIEKGEYFIPRYTKTEKSNYGLHSFLGIPLNSDDQVYGAITLEHVVPGKYSEIEKKHVQRLAAGFSTVFNRQSV